MSVLILFYIVFLSQIYLLSIYFPGQLAKRVRQVLSKYPPDKYGKLYPPPFDYFASREGVSRVRNWQLLNFAIAGLGLGILLAAVLSGYQPDPMGGDEIFVLAYAMIQFVPLFMAEIMTAKWFSRMRQEYAGRPKSAELQPRKLWDVVSPLNLFLALGIYLAMAAWFLQQHMGESERGATLITLFGLGAMNLGYFLLLLHRVHGRKNDPYKSHADQLHELKLLASILVISSIAASTILVLTDMADMFVLEVFDPVLISVFAQFCAVFSIGLGFSKTTIEDIDFEVYREDAGPVV
ncbi:MAG: hypothetical protein L3J04_03410 [Robiginitomaculum sp.]|nr:hypothetical protein [Robiginitomaculum sp.]